MIRPRCKVQNSVWKEVEVGRDGMERWERCEVEKWRGRSGSGTRTLTDLYQSSGEWIDKRVEKMYLTSGM